MVPDTVQLIVEVAGLCSSAPAFDMMRPAGIAPLRNAHRKRSYIASRWAGSSTSASVLATRAKRFVHRRVDRRAILGGQPVFPVPNVERRFLEWNLFDVSMLDPDRCAHFFRDAPLVSATHEIAGEISPGHALDGAACVRFHVAP